MRNAKKLLSENFLMYQAELDTTKADLKQIVYTAWKVVLIRLIFTLNLEVI
jgi:hypothetical protein